MQFKLCITIDDDDNDDESLFRKEHNSKSKKKILHYLKFVIDEIDL